MDIYQQVYALSLLSNALWNIKGKTVEQLQEQIQGDIQQRLPKIGNKSWSVVWGPTVWQSPKYNTGTADNTWVVFHNPSATFDDGTFEVYVVGIAGTAHYSDYDWHDEDLAVDTVIDFEAWTGTWSTNVTVPTGIHASSDEPVYISMGTATGLYALLSNKSPYNPQNLLTDFLKGLPSTARIIFTGHSLGGALSPSLAVGLVANNILPTANNAYVFATAGPSPGNQSFVTLYSHYFPLGTPKAGAPVYAAWNGNLWNRYDAVPQAWSLILPPQNINNIPTLWGNKSGSLVAMTIKGYLTKNKVYENGRKAQPVAYCPLPGATFGTPPTPPTLLNFRKLALTEHTTAYYTEIGVSPQYTVPLGGPEYQKTEREEENSVPIIRVAGIAQDQEEGIPA